ncbi:MAG: S1C family serine protease [Egibacteraceae bacterium]
MVNASRGVLAVALAFASASCLAPPPQAKEVPPPGVARHLAASRAATIVLRADSPERAARDLTLRVRASGCDALSTGSGFAIAPRAFVTNRHVIADASVIQVNTWDGRSLEAAVSRIAYYSDLALVVVDTDLPSVGALAPRDPQAGESVTIVGYPLGGQQIVGTGEVIDYVIGANLKEEMPVMRLSADVQPGNSGGPVLDQNGDVTGVVYAIELATRHALAIPVSTVRSLLVQTPQPPAQPAC